MTAQTDLHDAAMETGVDLLDPDISRRFFYDTSAAPERYAVAHRLLNRGYAIETVGTMLGYKNHTRIRNILNRDHPEPTTTFGPTRRQPSPAIERVIKIVTRELGVGLEQIRSTSRHPMLVLARGLIAWIGRRQTQASYPVIAEAIGNIDPNGKPVHSTIITAERRIQARIDASDPQTYDIGGETLTTKELAERLEKQLANKGR